MGQLRRGEAIAEYGLDRRADAKAFFKVEDFTECDHHARGTKVLDAAQDFELYFLGDIRMQDTQEVVRGVFLFLREQRAYRVDLNINIGGIDYSLQKVLHFERCDRFIYTRIGVRNLFMPEQGFQETQREEPCLEFAETEAGSGTPFGGFSPVLQLLLVFGALLWVDQSVISLRDLLKRAFAVLIDIGMIEFDKFPVRLLDRTPVGVAGNPEDFVIRFHAIFSLSV